MNWKYLLLVSLFVGILSCSKSDKKEKEEKLNQTGKAFMALVMERENWEKEWQIIKELGIPQPNKSRHIKEYYILPVYASKDNYYAIFYPIEDINQLGNPLYTGETCTEKELSSLEFPISKKDWEKEEPQEITVIINRHE